MSTANIVSSVLPGDVVTSHFNILIVVASYFASLVGCILTVELLNRRSTGVMSKRSWFESFGCATCLGLIGIWCMHFIGNRAITLGDGSSELQPVYSPAYSTASAFLPIIGLIGAFAVAERQWRSSRNHNIALAVTGVLAGFSVVGMHYVGNLGISNYRLGYRARFLAGSMVIAVGDCLIVMFLFYTWRSKWISRWWMRAMCAAVLAGGVSAMHFTAATDCVYFFKHETTPEAVRSRDTQVIVAAALCGFAGIAIIGIMLLFQYQDKVSRERSKKVMLSCAFFHPDGRLLVTNEGTLPAREITDKYRHRTFSEEFDTSHEVFHWIFRVTHNWTAVANMIPRMRNHLHAQRTSNDGEPSSSRPSSSASSAIYGEETYNDYAVLFRERFCVAAQSLASSMNLPINSIGVLYENIIETGTVKPETRAARDIETAPPLKTYGTGQLLFLTRQLDAESSDQFVNAGFRYATIEHVRQIIANTMQIPVVTVETHVANLRRYANNLSRPKKTGTYLCCFAMVPKASGGGHVVVKSSEQDELPDAKIMDVDPFDWEAVHLQAMHKKTFKQCEDYLQELVQGYSILSQQLGRELLKAMAVLAEQVPRALLDQAVFNGKPLVGSYRQSGHNGSPSSLLYAFVVVADAHNPINGSGRIMTTPLSFFKVRQLCSDASNRLAFAHKIHDEFTPLLARKLVKEGKAPKKMSLHVPTIVTNVIGSPSRRPSAVSANSGDPSNSSETHELVSAPDYLRRPRYTGEEVTPTEELEEREITWGGIVVNSETVIKNDTRSDLSIAPHVNGVSGERFEVRTAITAAPPEQTFVDELGAFAKELTKRGPRP